MKTLLISALSAALIAPAAAGAATPSAQQAELTLGGTAQAKPIAQQAERIAPDGAKNDLFGSSVAVSGDTLVVDAPVHDTGSGAGAVYVFEKPASGWKDATQTAELTLSEGAGTTAGPVAIDGDTIVVGGGDHKVGTHVQQGAAYVFVKPSSGWKNAHESAVLTASDGEAGDVLGTRLAVSGDTVIASAVGFGEDQGAAYVFVKPDAGWKDGTETARLTASDAGADDNFGSGLELDGDTLVVGANKHEVDQNVNAGAAYVFVKPAAGWAKSVESTELTAPAPAAQDQFGTAVAVSGDVVAVGAPNRTISARKQGAVYVFEEPSAGWAAKPRLSQASELTASDPGAGDSLGFGVAISGQTVAAGAPLHDQAAGATYVFTRPGEVWVDTTEAAQVSAGDGDVGALFGEAVALSGHVVFAGAPFHNVGANDRQGAAYVFGVPPEISIDSPVDGSSFTQGEAIAASYACDAATCIGPVASGSPLDTSTPGEHRFNVDALDGEGVSGTRTASYTVVQAGHDDPPPPPPPPPPPAKPVLSKLSVKVRKGTASFLLSREANVRLVLARSRAKHRFTPVRRFAFAGKGGLNTVRLSRKPLGRGRYRLTATPTDGSGIKGATHTATFRIAR
jgi:hypothetical protein